MEAVSSFAHPETASLLQSGYSDYQIGTFKNFDQLVEDALIVLGPRLKVFFQYELCFAKRMKSQLLISHSFSPSLPRREEEGKIKPLFRNIPVVFGISHQFLFQYGTLRVRRPRRCLARRCDQGERRYVGFTTEERGLVEAGLPERRGAARIGSDAEILFPPVYQRGGRRTGEASVPQCG